MTGRDIAKYSCNYSWDWWSYWCYLHWGWSWLRGCVRRDSFYTSSVFDEIERIYTVFCNEILIETSIYPFEKRISCFSCFCQCERPVWVKRSFFIINLYMEMRRGRKPCESDTSYKCSLVDRISWLYENL